jgi:hypothetical protein
MKFYIENQSNISAEILFKEHSNKEFNFTNHADISEVELNSE